MSLAWGDKVTITHYLKRQTLDGGGAAFFSWESMPIKGGEQTGVFLGWRTLNDGVQVCKGTDAIDEGYEPRRYYQVALVCYSPKRNPVYVPKEGLICHTPNGHCSHCGLPIQRVKVAEAK